MVAQATRDVIWQKSLMEISKLDHLVLTVKDIEESILFYTSVMGMERIIFGQSRMALKFGSQKINLHEEGKEIDPKAHKPTPGSYDLCFITKTPIDKAISHVEDCGVEIIEGPVDRTGANGKIVSFYFRDPDQNLIEVANER